MRSRASARVRNRRGPPALLAAPFQARQAHEAGHPPPPAVDAAVSELAMHPGRTVGAVGLVVDATDLLDEPGVGELLGRGRGLAAGVVGGPGDLEQLTAVLDAVTCGFLRLDERVHPHRVCLAKKAVARRMISTSSLRRRFPRRSWASSWRSSVVKPSRLALSTSAWRTHSRTADSVRSKSRASCRMLRSPCRYCRRCQP